jgi:GNAT superfamily N-acetyltransferase
VAEEVVTIREAEPADFVAVAGLRNEWKSDRPDDEDGLVRELPLWAARHGETHTCFVAEIDGAIVGCAWLAVTPRVPASGRLDRASGDVQSVYVTPHARGRGLGAALVDAVLTRARALGLERLTVHSSGEAVGLYRRLGFASSDILLDRNLP